MWVSDPLNRASYLLGGKGGETSFASSRRQTTSQLCDQFPCLSLQPPKVGKSNLVSWGGGEASREGLGDRQWQLPIRQGATIGQEIRQQIMPTVVDHSSYFLGLIMQQSIVNIGSGKERSLPQTPALIFTQNPNPNVCSSFLKRFF